ncbi:hypothetical protein DICPUDRAFT_85072 [Dictyostelium purpureum]|uniref:Uncharacterized protein n=1 Tax=Dictyostelium purpureum TaxID=5786 RepID=F1A4L8_DICPU|nr:uncharacterized protein DICPUDRAFT_85072 [Dictyostelium purpureum]EGC28863.1 hypothetical protein DICPUDRAFT_85072 [Dictyostelium purpureum]|eukprot:XP_003294610.1 hypothetical protein DICPUDRAFT_85072 [Dictyostelium purpureum]
MSQGTILDTFIGNEDINGTIIEKFPDQPPNIVRVILETNVNSYTKNLTIHVNRDRIYTVYSGYRNGITYKGGIKYSQVSFEIDPSRTNVLFSFWKARNFGLLERITERNYSVSSIQGNTLVISWPNRNNSQQFLNPQNRHSPSNFGLSNSLI